MVLGLGLCLGLVLGLGLCLVLSLGLGLCLGLSLGLGLCLGQSLIGNPIPNQKQIYIDKSGIKCYNEL